MTRHPAGLRCDIRQAFSLESVRRALDEVLPTYAHVFPEDRTASILVKPNLNANLCPHRAGHRLAGVVRVLGPMKKTDLSQTLRMGYEALSPYRPLRGRHGQPLQRTGGIRE